MEELKIDSVAGVKSSCHLFDLMLFGLTTSVPCFMFIYITSRRAICLLHMPRSFLGSQPSPFITWIICFISKLSHVRLSLLLQIVYDCMSGLSTDPCEISLMTTSIRKMDHLFLSCFLVSKGFFLTFLVTHNPRENFCLIA